MQNTITEIKNALEEANSRIQEAEERINKVEDRLEGITNSEQKREKILKTNEESLRELWDNVKCTNIRIIGVPGEERREGDRRNSPRDNSPKPPSHGNGTTHSNPGSTMSTMKNKPKEEYTETHIHQTDRNKDNEKILKAAREKKQITYKGTPVRLSADFSPETGQARREWHDIVNVMKGENLQPRLLYPARLSFRFEGESKTFTDNIGSPQ
uniref:L1 transposable element RRM domain-containing protein n=1 Tax=Sus scrofa TaxID=9823 RepID=A0A8D0RXL4_PIG